MDYYPEYRRSSEVLLARAKSLFGDSVVNAYVTASKYEFLGGTMARVDAQLTRACVCGGDENSITLDDAEIFIEFANGNILAMWSSELGVIELVDRDRFEKECKKY